MELPPCLSFQSAPVFIASPCKRRTSESDTVRPNCFMTALGHHLLIAAHAGSQEDIEAQQQSFLVLGQQEPSNQPHINPSCMLARLRSLCAAAGFSLLAAFLGKLRVPLLTCCGCRGCLGFRGRLGCRCLGGLGSIGFGFLCTLARLRGFNSVLRHVRPCRFCFSLLLCNLVRFLVMRFLPLWTTGASQNAKRSSASLSCFAGIESKEALVDDSTFSRPNGSIHTRPGPKLSPSPTGGPKIRHPAIRPPPPPARRWTAASGPEKAPAIKQDRSVW